MKELKNIFKLAKLDFIEDENLLKDVNNIIRWVNVINKIDINMENKQVSSLFMKLRDDDIRTMVKIEKIYENMPEKTDGFCIVPKVIKNG